MKAFLVILFLAAIGGGGYYWFVYKDKLPGDLLAPGPQRGSDGNRWQWDFSSSVDQYESKIDTPKSL